MRREQHLVGAVVTDQPNRAARQPDHHVLVAVEPHPVTQTQQSGRGGTLHAHDARHTVDVSANGADNDTRSRPHHNR
jgi:hypothetical protein